MTAARSWGFFGDSSCGKAQYLTQVEAGYDSTGASPLGICNSSTVTVDVENKVEETTPDSHEDMSRMGLLKAKGISNCNIFKVINQILRSLLSKGRRHRSSLLARGSWTQCGDPDGHPRTSRRSLKRR
ncbi:MAG: hypothetical protein MMC23_006074 [Stictis urceolatum]|nr:hypothetical protein [Stictis urceolata]